MSCNQLVRQLVPLLVDAAAASMRQLPGGTAQRQAAIQRLLQQSLATNVAGALALLAADGAPQQQQPQQQQACAAGALAAAAAMEKAPQLVDTALLMGAVSPGQLVRLRWEASDLLEMGGHGLLLLVTAAPPCSHLAVAAEHADGSYSQLAATSAALPSLALGLQSRWVPRHWQELMAGVDWQHNATRLLYVPFAAADGGQPLSNIDVAVLGSDGGGTLVLGQVLDAPLTQNMVQLLPPGSGTAVLPGDHTAAVALKLPAQAWPGSASGSCTAGNTVSISCLGALLLGSTPPLSLHIQAEQCRGNPIAQLLPAVLSVATSASPADSVRVAGGGVEPGGAIAVVDLWDGLEPGARQLLLLTDPGCSYALR